MKLRKHDLMKLESVRTSIEAITDKKAQARKSVDNKVDARIQRALTKILDVVGKLAEPAAVPDNSQEISELRAAVAKLQETVDSKKYPAYKFEVNRGKNGVMNSVDATPRGQLMSVPIKVKIGLRANGHADHPDWTQLQYCKDNLTYRPGQEMGGWKYDKTSGHKEATGDSPMGQQLGMLIVPQEFATQAITKWPDLITQMSEAEAQTFYDTKVTAHIPENRHDLSTLQGLKTEYDLMVILEQDTTAIKAKITDAINPNHAEAGIKKQAGKTWTDAKTENALTISAVVTEK